MPKLALKLLILVAITFLFMNTLSGQETKAYVRIAKIIVDSAELDAYKSELKTGMETAVCVEPGVLSMYAVSDNDRPTHITILETYASKDAYNSHIQTAHFKKYKSNTLAMVKSLELIDVVPIAYEAKIGQLSN